MIRKHGNFEAIDYICFKKKRFKHSEYITYLGPPGLGHYLFLVHKSLLSFLTKLNLYKKRHYSKTKLVILT